MFKASVAARFQFRLFYSSLNAGLFELWHVTIDNIEANLH